MLVKNWKTVTMKAWSMYAMYLVVILQVVPELIKAYNPAVVETDLFNYASAAAAIAGIIGRLLDQGGDDESAA